MSRTPPSDNPKYPIPWIATYFIVAIALIGGSFIMLWYVNLPASKFDYDDPDIKFLEAIVLSDTPRRGDFSELNGGDWQALCLSGLDGDLGSALEAAGIAPDQAKSIVAEAGRNKADLTETEAMLVYVDMADETRAVLHPHGFAFSPAGSAVCTRREAPEIGLPAGR